MEPVESKKFVMFWSLLIIEVDSNHMVNKISVLKARCRPNKRHWHVELKVE